MFNSVHCVSGSSDFQHGIASIKYKPLIVLLVIVQCLTFKAILLCNLLILSLPDLFWSEFIFEQEFEDTKGVRKSMKLYSIIVYFYKYQRNVLNWLTISDWVERRHFTSLVGYCYYLRWLLPGRHHSGCSVYWDLL